MFNNSFLTKRFFSVVDRYLKGTSSADEDKLVDYFYDTIEDEDTSTVEFDTVKAEIKAVVDKRIREQPEVLKQKSGYVYIKIAASIVLVVASSLYFYSSYFSNTEKVADSLASKSSDDNVPIIVLNNGQSYRLEDTLGGRASYKMVGNERVFILADSMLSEGSQKLSKVKNPTDKIFAFLLEDGTTAWLNPNSTLEILSEENQKRTVRIEGTVLFDVQKIKTKGSYMPFVVKTRLQTIEVLGTKFIVNASDGKTEDILLLEGKVRLTHNNFQSQVTLKPDQKASLKYDESNILVTKSSETYKVEAWNKGLFHFENEKMSDVMGEIAQWYKKDIIVDDAIKNIPITGMISRYKTINEVLQIIELTNSVKYKKQGEKIYVN
jgi:ferric-dicitrate binding protein FerR (iron transport regulator)